jgi:hypothetical protein
MKHTRHKRQLTSRVQEQLLRIQRDYKIIPQYQVVTSSVGTEHIINSVDVVTGNPIEWPEEFYVGGARREAIYDAIDEERAYQIEKFGADKENSIPGFLIILENELNEAKAGWTKNLTGRHSAMHEIRQIAATCVAAMEIYGTTGSAIATNDIPT